MSKIGLIIEREYISRVSKRSFLILTFLTPLLIVAMCTLPMILSQITSDDIQNIAVIDHTGKYPNAITDFSNYRFVQMNGEVEVLRKDKSIYAIVLIANDLSTTTAPISIYSDKQITIELKNHIKRELEQIASNEKITSHGIENLKQIIEESRVKLNIETIKFDQSGELKQGSSEMAMIVGFISTFLIYIFIFMYGAQVMQGVMQEKTSRIVEVMISSVRPFELMMGKIIGIALVGLTQFMLWVILSGGILAWIGVVFGTNLGAQASPMPYGSPAEIAEMTNETQKMLSVIMGLNLTEMILMFIVYFIGGYLLYASFFAAVGAAVDSETDTQQFMLPITIPIIFALYAAVYSSQNPDGPLAFWCSMIPLTSPIVMMVRLPYDVPIWQLVTSVTILYATFILTTYFSARIYRVGILMYGKKTSWKEMWKWVKRSN